VQTLLDNRSRDHRMILRAIFTLETTSPLTAPVTNAPGRRIV
jgi:hypothetical protein